MNEKSDAESPKKSRIGSTGASSNLQFISVNKGCLQKGFIFFPAVSYLRTGLSQQKMEQTP